MSRERTVTIHRANLAAWLAAQGPFDPDYDLFATPPRRRSNPPQPQRRRPQLATLCRWCMERTVNPVFFETWQNPPDFQFLCEQCRIQTRMFAQRLALHRAMTALQGMRATLELMDLDNHLLPE